MLGHLQVNVILIDKAADIRTYYMLDHGTSFYIALVKESDRLLSIVSQYDALQLKTPSIGIVTNPSSFTTSPSCMYTASDGYSTIYTADLLPMMRSYFKFQYTAPTTLRYKRGLTYLDLSTNENERAPSVRSKDYGEPSLHRFKVMHAFGGYINNKKLPRWLVSALNHPYPVNLPSRYGNPLSVKIITLHIPRTDNPKFVSHIHSRRLAIISLPNNCYLLWSPLFRYAFSIPCCLILDDKLVFKTPLLPPPNATKLIMSLLKGEEYSFNQDSLAEILLFLYVSSNLNPRSFDGASNVGIYNCKFSSSAPRFMTMQHDIDVNHRWMYDDPLYARTKLRLVMPCGQRMSILSTNLYTHSCLDWDSFYV